MPTSEDALYSNPVAPVTNVAHMSQQDEDNAGNLTNADFRKLLMTPRSAPQSAPPSRPKIPLPKEFDEIDDAASRRRKKKNYYAKLRKQEEEREKELAEKYRDRARERRDGLNPDYQHLDAASTSKTAEYRAVAPTADATHNAAEQRRLAIQESKFLGGDMEHTHLVKGLDFALLQKVRSEQTDSTTDEVEKEVVKDKKEPVKDEIQFKSVEGRKIHNIVFNSRVPERNDLFTPGRMAYVFDIEDEYGESDIPTISIRSKADCPVLENQSTVTTNDIVVNKLTQILSYLRQGVRTSKKHKKKDKDAFKGRKVAAEESIYGKIGDYKPAMQGSLSSKKDKKNASKSSQYFQKNPEHESDRSRSKPEASVKDLVKSVNEKYGKQGSSNWKEVKYPFDQLIRYLDSYCVVLLILKLFLFATKKSKSNKHGIDFAEDSYAECYPGAIEMADAAGDSDDEADYTKMDLGNKKGPIGRWDFDNEDEYNTYMESREAMPKAAFQFGIKMSEGRKTRTKGGHMTEKQKLDREWQKISQIISKRKNPESGRDDSKRRKDD
eukprot:gene7376-8196_t